jgi:hypothetical protein
MTIVDEPAERVAGELTARGVLVQRKPYDPKSRPSLLSDFLGFLRSPEPGSSVTLFEDDDGKVRYYTVSVPDPELEGLRQRLDQLEPAVDPGRLDRIEADVARVDALEAKVAEVDVLKATVERIPALEAEVTKVRELETKVAQVDRLAAEVEKLPALETKMTELENLSTRVRRLERPG